jgi:hypothetical protein
MPRTKRRPAQLLLCASKWEPAFRCFELDEPMRVLRQHVRLLFPHRAALMRRPRSAEKEQPHRGHGAMSPMGVVRRRSGRSGRAAWERRGAASGTRPHALGDHRRPAEASAKASVEPSLLLAFASPLQLLR